MKKLKIVSNATRTFYKTGLIFKKHSPEILLAAGVVGVIAGTVMACKATTKAKDILDDAKTNIADVHDVLEDVEAGIIKKEYTVEDSKKALTVIYAQTGVKLVKLYAPAVAVGTLAITSILTSHNILKKRYLASAAAYTLIDKSFKEYRGRVVERFGKEVEREIRHNIKTKEIEETVVAEDGSESVVKTTVDVIDPNNYSDYARIFDDGNVGWDKDPEQSLFFLKQQQRFANEKLKTRGYLFLNEVYEMLGFPITKYGNHVGWVYDEQHPIGDNFVDFGLYDQDNPKVRDFVNGRERVIILDFNVDGNVLELIG